MAEKNNFSKTDFFRSKHAAIRTFITVIMIVLFAGATIISTFLIFNKNSESGENIETAKNLLLCLALFELVLFVGYCIWMLLDNKYEINKHVFEVTENLLKECKSAFLVDFKSDSYKQIRDIDLVFKGKTKDNSFLTEILKYLENNVYFKERDFLKEEFDYKTILQKLSKQEFYTLYYREIENEKCEWAQITFSNFSPELFLVTISTRGTKILEEKLSTLKEEDYFALFVADLDRDEITTIKSSPFYKESGGTGQIASFTNAMKSFSKVHQGDTKEIFENLSNIELIKQSLMIENKRVFFYKSSDRVGGNWVSVTNYVLCRNQDGTPAVISLGFSKLDSYGSDRQELRLQLKDALTMAEGANKAKNLFFNNMSYTIRTPMNAILTYSSLANSHMDNLDQVSSYLTKIKETSNQLSAVINDILDMSKIESGRISIEERNEDLREIIRSLNEIVHANIQSKQINFETNVDIINKNIICDKFRLKQAILNILSNAEKFTPEDGTIVFSVKQLGDLGTGTGKYEFRIKDTGVGMNKETLETIYNPFIKKNSFINPANTGSGLGMVITKNIIDMMHGEISISSIPNKGTEVVITLPLQYADEHVEQEETNIYREKDFIGTKLLLVEDNPISSEISMNSLKEFGFIVESVENGQQAIEELTKPNSSDYLAVLIDISMPEMNGFETTKAIRKLNNKASKIPVIGMTGSKFKEDRILMVESGMNGFLPKPVQIDHLIEILSKNIKK
ncbi:MAG: hybrid sensor histidine kinase/response regulator [Bacilli bacterium]|nr:hybrid sensor histidine kinase/response regulator [Bacilli bacterium]